MKFVPAKKRNAAKCRASGKEKIRYRTREDATRALRSYRAMAQEPEFYLRDKWPSRVYLCPACKGWHLTSLVSFEQRAAMERGEQHDAG